MARKSSKRKGGDLVSITEHLPTTAPAEDHRRILDKYVLWHGDCEPDHGVMTNVSPAFRKEVQDALVFFYGRKCYWVELDETDMTYNIEFVNTNGRNGPHKPWDWCGTSVGYEAAHVADLEARTAVGVFKEGQRVEFTHAGVQHTGLVARVNDKTATVVVEGQGSFYVPGKDLK